MTGMGDAAPGLSLDELARIVAGRPVEAPVGAPECLRCQAVALHETVDTSGVVWFAESEAALAQRRPGIVVAAPAVAADIGDRVLAARREWSQSGRPGGPFAHARVDESAFVSPGCVVARGAVLEAGVVLAPGCVIGPAVTIGGGAVLGANCTVRHTAIGPGCEVGESAVLGADPSSFRMESAGLRRTGDGSLHIEAHVRIGPRTVVERGADGDTRLRKDALVFGAVYIAHDVDVGRGTVLVAGTSVASGVVLEDGAVVYGESAVAQDVRIGAGAIVLGGSHVWKSVRPHSRVRGQPARPLNADDPLHAVLGISSPSKEGPCRSY
jgi:UDP-3-O-[3-hydroxymyristoyl] glucosamine N-acyltransferase